HSKYRKTCVSSYYTASLSHRTGSEKSSGVTSVHVLYLNVESNGRSVIRVQLITSQVHRGNYSVCRKQKEIPSATSRQACLVHIKNNSSCRLSRMTTQERRVYHASVLVLEITHSIPPRL